MLYFLLAANGGVLLLPALDFFSLAVTSLLAWGLSLLASRLRRKSLVTVIGSVVFLGAYFAVTDARRELSAWSDRLRVSSRGYMLGYNDLRNQNVRKFFRFLSKVGDGMMNMQIVRLDFAKENKKQE